MLENILIGIVFGLVTTGLLELWRQVRMRRGEAATEQTSHPAWRTILRLLLAILIGFVMGALTAGFLVEMGVEEIAFGSLLANTLIAVWTGLVWWYLSTPTSKSSVDA